MTDSNPARTFRLHLQGRCPTCGQDAPTAQPGGSMEIEPIDPQFEAEVAHLAGKQRKGEAAVDHMRRIARIRGLLRLEAARPTGTELEDES